MTGKYDDNNRIKCSFCGKSQDQVERIIAGPDVYICNECVEMCADILGETQYFTEDENREDMLSGKLPVPAEIAEFLSEYVIGQDLSLIHI